MLHGSQVHSEHLTAYKGKIYDNPCIELVKDIPTRSFRLFVIRIEFIK